MSSGSAKAGKASADAIIGQLRKLESPKDREGMARYGIKTDKAFGVSLYVLRDMAKGIGTDHDLALALWDSGIHEAQLLAGIVDDPARVTGEQMDRWIAADALRELQGEKVQKRLIEKGSKAKKR